MSPQAPQFIGSYIRLVSQPVAGMPSQSSKPGRQMEIMQAPLPHTTPGGHAFPHVPQFAGSLSRFVSQPFVVLPSQSACPDGQMGWVQMLFWHVPGHTRPHPPQLSGSFVTFVSQPFEQSPSQSAVPGLQAQMPQTPAEQVGLPPTAGQTLPHAPQFWMSVVRSISQPLEASPSQSARPGAQTQLPPAQTVSGGHEAPHAPQWFGSVMRSAQMVPQQARPAGHAHVHWP
jgi:hypothetical protein